MRRDPVLTFLLIGITLIGSIVLALAAKLTLAVLSSYASGDWPVLAVGIFSMLVALSVIALSLSELLRS